MDLRVAVSHHRTQIKRLMAQSKRRGERQERTAKNQRRGPRRSRVTTRRSRGVGDGASSARARRMVRRMKDMTKPHPRCCGAAVWGCGHGPETPGWSRSGSFDLPWRDFSQIDVIAYIACRPPISVVCGSTGGFLTRQTRVFHSTRSYLGRPGSWVVVFCL